MFALYSNIVRAKQLAVISYRRRYEYIRVGFHSTSMWNETSVRDNCKLLSDSADTTFNIKQTNLNRAWNLVNMPNFDHHVVVLGATPKPGRFAHQAVLLLKKHEYKITPVHPRFEEIEGLRAVKHLTEINDPVHTLTLYVNAARLDNMIDEVLGLKPQRVIFNPGTESRALQKALSDNNIQWVEDCTLVMLNSGSF